MEPEKQLYFRPALPKDELLLWQWRNEEETRRQSFHTNPVTKQEHHQWFERVLRDDTVTLLLLYEDTIPVGTARITHRGLEGEISYSIARGYRGRGYGKTMIQLLSEYANKRGMVSLCARVKPDNYASQKVLRDNGFSQTGTLSGQAGLLFTKAC